MKQFLILFREADGRAGTHQPEEIQRHQQNWQQWIEQQSTAGKWIGGSPLTLTGATINTDQHIHNGLYAIGTEIVGGFIILHAASLEEATAIAQTCPIFEFDGYAEVREMIFPGIPVPGKTS